VRDPARGPEDPAREEATRPVTAGSGRRTATPANNPGDPAHRPPTPAHGPEPPKHPTPATVMPAHKPEHPVHPPATQAPAGAVPAQRPRAPARTTAATPGETASPPREEPVAAAEREPAGREAGLAHGIADAVRRCPDVVDLSGGPFGTVATYLPGERVPGVALHEDGIEISVVVRLGRPLPEIADEVRAAVAPLADDLPVNVHIGGLT
jgi:hypothetical protein